ncbi:MAG TPA: phosphoenolpyruvate--protein phosphotransferase [Bacillota bacterium]|nr:phosphoenolpyruvate--protein phosphotransferase [Bacillota bacterium]
MMFTIRGIAASNGIAIAKAFRLESPKLIVKRNLVADRSREICRLDDALARTKQEIEVIRNQTLQEIGADKAAIFEAHLLVLSDPELINPIKEKITSENVNADFALKEIADQFISIFESMDNDYMKERAADIHDVTQRILAHLLGVRLVGPSSLSEEVIIIAEDLTPSDTAQLNRKYALGFTTDMGGRTSHSAIMARTLEIPAVVGTKEATAKIVNGVTIILDGFNGEVIVDPTEDLIEWYQDKQKVYEKQKSEWAKLKEEPTFTKDGYQVKLVANIGTVHDVEGVINNGGEGVGLYRTEFLYMERSNFPTEEEQFEAYKAVLEAMSEGKPVVVRTLDIGGDKELSYLDMPHEMNPFLGYRAIRLCLDRTDIFRTQLRALLRASIYGNLKIMFPMIAILTEFRAAKAIFLEEKEKLMAEGIPVSDMIEVGMMVEIPSSAIMADQFAKEVDFFSIGTNDLIQYTMAADRMNEQVTYLYQPYNPAILRLVKMVIDAANNEGKWVGMCGEMAGDRLAIPLLIGLGLHEFSMSATSILPARSQISRLSKTAMEELVQEALKMSTVEEVMDLVSKLETFE